MVQFIVGLLLGMYVATHSPTEMASVVEQGVQSVKSVKITTEK